MIDTGGNVLDRLPERFRLPYRSIERLQAQERYRGAFIFGSLARGEATADSDFDVKVITEADSTCTNINHPFIGGVKLDITFQSLAQLTAFTDDGIHKAERIPMIAESIIIFDKTGALAALKRRAMTAQPKKIAPDEYQLMQFMVYHVDNKVARQLKADEAGALLSMAMGIGELVKFHYQIRGKWQVSDKRLLRDLQNWDVPFAPLLRRFALAADVAEKYALWETIVDYLLMPLGGRQPIAENNCLCDQCRADLANFEFR